MLARIRMRQGWRRIVALALLIGVVGGTALALAAGARRTDSSLDRFRRASRAADVELAVRGTPSAAELRLLRSAASIVAVAPLRAIGVIPDKLVTLQAIGAPLDGAFGTAVDRGRIIAGRAAD